MPRLAAPPPPPTSLPAGPFELDFEESQLTEQQVRDLVWEEMRFYHPEA
jgi:hypothetical protein